MILNGEPYRCPTCGESDPTLDDAGLVIHEAVKRLRESERSAHRSALLARVSASVCLVMAGVNFAYSVPRIVSMFTP